tara:strand:- start:187 stop:369 length:183 start_codon:yes stop_codon:yes gene_type:complete
VFSKTRGINMLYDIGEKPGKGKYQCTSCLTWTVTLDDDSDRLPPCGECGPGQDVKYRRIL